MASTPTMLPMYTKKRERFILHLHVDSMFVPHEAVSFLICCSSLPASLELVAMARNEFTFYKKWVYCYSMGLPLHDSGDKSNGFRSLGQEMAWRQI
jgi:hypothetical protein